MKFEQELGFGFGHAICYSGYREGQSPITNTYPSYQQVVEDLKILQEKWQYLRIYDSSYHADLVLIAITKEQLNLKVMLGVDMAAEQNNPQCPWEAHCSDEQLTANQRANEGQVDRLVILANEYPDTVFSLSVGNEATVEWSDHLVSVERLMGFVDHIKQNTVQPVTFCENYVPWIGKLEPLVAKLDFISLHTYPVWEYHTVESALQYTKANFKNVALHYPDKPIIVTEAGWTTKSNGRGIQSDHASEALQRHYYRELLDWSHKKQILVFVFEAFDEPWKGSDDCNEPEKHWGVFTVDRKPKLVMQEFYSHL